MRFRSYGIVVLPGVRLQNGAATVISAVTLLIGTGN